MYQRLTATGLRGDQGRMSEDGTPFDQEVADKIIAALEEGQTLVEICKRDGMPHRRTVYKWRDEHAEFGAHFARARMIGYDVWFEECKDIAEDGSNDYVVRKSASGAEFDSFDTEHVQRSKLRIETRLKLLARIDPKKYGDRTQLAATDIDGNDVQLPSIVFMPVAAKPREE